MKVKLIPIIAGILMPTLAFAPVTAEACSKDKNSFIHEQLYSQPHNQGLWKPEFQ